VDLKNFLAELKRRKALQCRRHVRGRLLAGVL